MLGPFFVNQKNKLPFLHLNKRLLTFILCLLLLTNFSPKAQAQYFGLGSGLGYNGLGASLLYPFSYLFGGAYGNSYAYSLPFYGLAAIGSGFANNAIYNSYRNIPYNYTNNYQNNNLGNYQGNNYSLGYPTNTNYNSIINSSPTWNYSANQNSSAPQISQPSNDQNDIFNVQYPLKTSDNSSLNKPPLIAPDRHNLNTNNNAGFMPINNSLMGFFQTVNSRYKGNLLRALNQNDMLSWAQSLGIVRSDYHLPRSISQSRKAAIQDIAKDSSLDLQKKAEILHSLLELP